MGSADRLDRIDSTGSTRPDKRDRIAGGLPDPPGVEPG